MLKTAKVLGLGLFCICVTVACAAGSASRSAATVPSGIFIGGDGLDYQQVLRVTSTAATYEVWYVPTGATSVRHATYDFEKSPSGGTDDFTLSVGDKRCGTVHVHSKSHETVDATFSDGATVGMSRGSESDVRLGIKLLSKTASDNAKIRAKPKFIISYPGIPECR